MGFISVPARWALLHFPSFLGSVVFVDFRGPIEPNEIGHITLAPQLLVRWSRGLSCNKPLWILASWELDKGFQFIFWKAMGRLSRTLMPGHCGGYSSGEWGPLC
ncbi:hypothetical protein ACOSQ2_013750 [Xanthoceras sorbifolium]